MELISKEDALMCLTGEYSEGEEYKYDEIIHRFIQRLQSVPTVPAVPMSVIEGIKEEVQKLQTYMFWSSDEKKVELYQVLQVIDDAIEEYTNAKNSL